MDMTAAGTHFAGNILPVGLDGICKVSPVFRGATTHHIGSSIPVVAVDNRSISLTKGLNHRVCSNGRVI